MNTLDAKLRGLRELGFSYASIARYAGIDTSVVSRVANEKGNPTPETIHKIEMALNVVREVVPALLEDE